MIGGTEDVSCEKPRLHNWIWEVVIVAFFVTWPLVLFLIHQSQAEFVIAEGVNQLRAVGLPPEQATALTDIFTALKGLQSCMFFGILFSTYIALLAYLKSNRRTMDVTSLQSIHDYQRGPSWTAKRLE